MSWELIPILMIAGAVLLAFEVFVPGMILATAGTLCLASSVVITFKLYGPLLGVTLLIFEVLAFIAVASRWIHWFPKSKFGRQIILHSTSGDEPQIDNKEELLQQTGTVVATCRPSGIAEFAKRRYDVISEGSFLATGQAVKVIAVEGSKIIVRAV